MCNPGKRDGQIHLQDNKGEKYLYNFEKNEFVAKNGKPLPKSIRKMIESDKGLQNAIKRGKEELNGKR